MKITFDYTNGAYHFIWVKGIIEIVMSFILLYGLTFRTNNNYSIIMFIFILILLFFGVKDLQYFLKLKDKKDGDNYERVQNT